MKIILFALYFSGLIFGCFTDSEYVKKTIYNQSSDSIPPANTKIVNFVKGKIGKKVATGECWDLASEALNSINAKWDHKYKFGKEIDYKKEKIYPGDVIQFENVILNYERDGKKFTEKMMHHTAIIFETKDVNNFTIAHQNNGYSGRKVGVSPLDITTLSKGKFKIYRPEI